jgi:hypothetical protein
VKLRLLLGMCVLGLASACGGDSDGGGGGGGSGDTIRVTLEEQNNSGKSGTADLFPGAASTDVTVEVTGGQSDLDPIHVHSGTCEMPGEEIVHDLGFTTASLGQGQIFETMDKVATGGFVIDIHDDESQEVIMCGVIPQQ